MRRCYLCDAPIHGTAQRRFVPTGRSAGTFVSTRSWGGSSRRYSGSRIVCDNCADRTDRAQGQSENTFWIVLGILIVVFLLYNGRL